MRILRIISILYLFFNMTTGYAQKVKTYKVWVTLVNQKQVKGTLYAANKNEFIILGNDFTQLKFDPGNIRVIKLRREGIIGKGAWIGAVSGLAVGSIAGYASESGSGWEAIGAVGGGILGTPIGALIGMGVGLGKEKFMIHGNSDTYGSLLPMLQKYIPHKSI